MCLLFPILIYFAAWCNMMLQWEKASWTANHGEIPPKMAISDMYAGCRLNNKDRMVSPLAQDGFEAVLGHRMFTRAWLFLESICCEIGWKMLEVGPWNSCNDAPRFVCDFLWSVESFQTLWQGHSSSTNAQRRWIVDVLPSRPLEATCLLVIFVFFVYSYGKWLDDYWWLMYLLKGVICHSYARW